MKYDVSGYVCIISERFYCRVQIYSLTGYPLQLERHFRFTFFSIELFLSSAFECCTFCDGQVCETSFEYINSELKRLTFLSHGQLFLSTEFSCKANKMNNFKYEARRRTRKTSFSFYTDVTISISTF